MQVNTILTGDALDVLTSLPDAFVQVCVTSPPYYKLRSYLPEKHADKHLELGLEETPEHYIERLVAVFREVKRVLRPDGTLWVNIADSYAGGGAIDPYRRTTSGKLMPPQGRGRVSKGIKSKDLIGIPWMLAFALRADGWWLRQDIIWHKPNCMPESVTDRSTKSHEYLFLLAKNERYYYDGEAIREEACEASLRRIQQPNFANQTGGPKDYRNGINPNRSMRQTLENFAQHPRRNKRSVWTIPTTPLSMAHFATFPPKLIEPCILAGSRPGDIVLDCFMGVGTTALVALQHGRRYVGIELNPAYVELAEQRISVCQPNIWTSQGVA